MENTLRLHVYNLNFFDCIEYEIQYPNKAQVHYRGSNTRGGGGGGGGAVVAPSMILHRTFFWAGGGGGGGLSALRSVMYDDTPTPYKLCYF